VAADRLSPRFGSEGARVYSDRRRPWDREGWRGDRKFFLARLCAGEQATLKFAFGLEPIFQIAAWLLAAFEIEFVGATSDFLLTRRVHD